MAAGEPWDDLVEHGTELLQCHGDVGSEGPLDFDGTLWCDLAPASVDVRLELDAVFLDLAQVGQRKSLVAAAIGENRALPVHELVKAPKLANELMTGPEVEVVGVAKNDLGTQFFKIFRGDCLDSRLGSNRHKYWCFDLAVQCVDNAAPGPAFP